MLGLKHNKNTLVDYDPDWEVEFVRERERIAVALGSVARGIEHYGSTSVKGMRAKPILDILVGISPLSDWKKCHDPLINLGYDYAAHAGVPGHYIFGRGKDSTERTHLVHVVEFLGESWRSNLALREALRRDPNLRRAYVEEKERAIATAPDSRARYNELKQAFIDATKAGLKAGPTMELPPNAALIVIDVQYAIDAPYHAAEGPRNNRDAEAKIAAMLTAFRGSGRPVLHIRHDSVLATSSYRPGQPGNDFKAEVAPLPGETVIAKRTNSAFIGTKLEEMLRADGISVLIVAGVATNNSVEATVRMAGNLGFDVRLVEDACFTFAKRDYDGRLRNAGEVHAMALANMNEEYCAITSSAAVIAAC